MKVEQLQEGALCQLKIGRWDARVKMPTEKLGKNIPKEIVRAVQDLIEDRTLLDDLATIKRTAKGFLWRNSLPFPVDGVFWLPKNRIVKIDERFQELQTEHFKRVDTLVDNYGRLISDFKSKYPDYYRKDKYPTSNGLRNKYYFYWNFFHFEIPSKKSKILSPAMYKRETEKLKDMVNKMEEMTINIIGNTLIDRLNSLAKQCESGKVNAHTVNSFDNFVKKWDDLWKDHVDEKKMKSIMIMLKRHAKKMTTDRLKDNETFRNEIQKYAEKTVGKIKNIPNFELKRSLDI